MQRFRSTVVRRVELDILVSEILVQAPWGLLKKPHPKKLFGTDQVYIAFAHAF